MTARLALLTVAVALSGLLSGCFHTDTVLTVHADGSATLEETVAVDGILGLGAAQWLQESGLPEVEGARRTLFEAERTPGAFVMRATYAVGDVSALRYDLRDAGGVARMMRGLASWSRGQDEIPAHSPAVLAFAFDAGGGVPAALRVTVPERTVRASDLTRLPWHSSDALAQLMGAPGEMTPEQQAEMRAYLAEMPPDERAGLEAEALYIPERNASEAHVLAGTASARFTVRVDGTLDSADGGRAVRRPMGDAVVITDFRADALSDLAHEAPDAFDAAARTVGFDAPNTFVPPPGDITIRFR